MAIAAVLALVGCALIPWPPPRDFKKEFSARWVNMDEDSLIVQYGKPQEVLALSSGNYVDSYRTEVPYSASSGRAVVNDFGGSGSSGAVSTVLYCERRFEIAKADKKIVRAVIVGNGCDYSK